MAKDVRAGGAFIELGIKSAIQKQLAKGSKDLKSYGRQISATGAVMAATGAAALAPLTKALVDFGAAGDQFNKTSIRTGISVEALSQLRFAAEQSGSSIESVSNGVWRAYRRIGNAATGMGPAVRALDALGLSADALSMETPESALGILADALNSVENEAIRSQLGFEIFGNQFRDMIPLLREGSTGIRSLMSEADALGATMSTADAQAAADYTDGMNRLKTSVRGLTMELGASLAPMMADISTKIAEAVASIKPWLSENRELIKTIAIGAAGLVGLGTAIAGIGATVAAFGAAVGLAGVAIGALMSPIGLVITGLGILTAAFYKSFGGMGKIIEWFHGRFGDLVEGVGQNMQAIMKAVSSGNLGEAWAIVVETMELIWLDLTSSIQGAWGDTMKWIVDAATTGARGVGVVFEAMAKGILRTLDFISRQQNWVKNRTTEAIAKVTGERIVGGDVFTGSALPPSADAAIRAAAQSLGDVGEALQSGAGEFGANTKAGIDARLAARLARLDALKGGAADRAAAIAAAEMGKPDAMPTLPTGTQLAQMAGAGAGAGGSIAGTFSSFGAFALGRGGGTLQQQIADNTKRGADAGEEVAKEAKKNKGARLG